MNRRKYLKKVELPLLAQRAVLIGCVAAMLAQLALPGLYRWLAISLNILGIGCVAAAVIFNLLAFRAVEETDNTLDAILRRGGAVLVEEKPVVPNDNIDGKLMHDLREMVKEFLNLGSTQQIIRTQTNLVALQNQINPHFLYNTLEVIRAEAIMEGAENVPDMIETLSRLFRYGISNREDLVTLSEELKNVQDYFRIQQYRFKERYRLCVSDPQDVSGEDILVPKLTLQPLVENAILHAFRHQSEPGTVTIRLAMTEQRLKITVSDDGCGMDAQELGKLREKLRAEAHGAYQSIGRDTTGIALQNINKRVRLFFGDEYGLSVFSLPAAGTDVVVTVPRGAR